MRPHTDDRGGGGRRHRATSGRSASPRALGRRVVWARRRVLPARRACRSPRPAAYEGFPQHENGVGMVRPSSRPSLGRRPRRPAARRPAAGSSPGSRAPRPRATGRRDAAVHAASGRDRDRAATRGAAGDDPHRWLRRRGAAAAARPARVRRRAGPRGRATSSSAATSPSPGLITGADLARSPRRAPRRPAVTCCPTSACRRAGSSTARLGPARGRRGRPGRRSGLGARSVPGRDRRVPRPAGGRAMSATSHAPDERAEPDELPSAARRRGRRAPERRQVDAREPDRGRRVAIVEERPGVTRDRLELECEWTGRSLLVVDTGGVVERGDALDKKVTDAGLRALGEADVVLFVLDATTGRHRRGRRRRAELLRRHGGRSSSSPTRSTPTRQEADAWELAGLGLGDPVLVSALARPGRRRPARRRRRAPPAGRSSRRTRRRRRGDGGGEPAGARRRAPGVHVGEAGRGGGHRRAAERRQVDPVQPARRARSGRVVHDLPGTTRDAIDTLVETDEGRPLHRHRRAAPQVAERGGAPSTTRSSARCGRIDRADVALLVHRRHRGRDPPGPAARRADRRCGQPDRDRAQQVGPARHRAPAVEVADATWRTGSASSATRRCCGSRPRRARACTGSSRRCARRSTPTTAGSRPGSSTTRCEGDPVRAPGAGAPGSSTPCRARSTRRRSRCSPRRRLPPGYLRYVERSLRERFDLGPTPLKLRVRLRGKS